MTVVSKHCLTDCGKAYLSVDSKPFLFNSIQCRMPDDGDIEANFSAVFTAGYKMVSIWFYWRDIEPERGEYNFSVLKKIIQCAEKYDLRVELIWAGTNFCDKLDNRFAPEWIVKNATFYAKDSKGAIILANGSDMGSCYVANVNSRNLFLFEKTALLKTLDFLSENDTKHRVILFQIENDINMNQYPCGKKAVLRYIDRLCAAMATHEYQVATSVTVSAWQQEKLDMDIDALKNITAQGISTFKPRVSYTRNIIANHQTNKFKYISSNAAYENTISHIIATLCNGGFYSIYRIDKDVLWDRPGVYDEGFIDVSITARLKQFNRSLNKISSIVAITSPKDMVEFNTECDGMPDMFYFGKKRLGDIDVGFITRCNIAVGMGLFHENKYYFITDSDADLIFYEQPTCCEVGAFENGRWNSKGIRYPRVYNSEFYIKCDKGECIRVNFEREG